MSKIKNKGIFILFEGPDKSGKTTQAKLLTEYLEKKGYNVILTREPGGTDVGEKIRNILLDPDNKISPLTELLLYEASRAQHVSEKIKPALQKGYIVICDRFTIASLAYQGFGRGINLKLVEKLNHIATEGIKPDIIFGFKLSESDYQKRVKGLKDRIENENEKFRKKVKQGYLKIYQNNKKIKVIDASKSIEEIHKIIKNTVERKLKCRQR